jgi:uncharacterized protein (TIGR03790 family)
VYTVRAIVTVTSIAILAALASAAPPLTPGEVLVLANSASGDSLAVAEAYVRLREIPKENLVAVPMPLSEEVSRADYNKLIREPARRAMADRHLAAVRCICLIYGVPLRISAESNEPQDRDVYRYYLKESGARLTQMRESLFVAAPAAARQQPPSTDIDDLLKELTSATGRGLASLASISDPAQRRAATRQVLAQYRDLYGLRGLVDLLEYQRLDGSPPLEDLRKELRTAEEVLSHALQTKPSDSGAKQKLAMLELAGGLWGGIAYARGQIDALKPTGTDASVDSELALLQWDRYELEGPMPNPLHWRAAATTAAATGNMAQPIVMTSRIDGPCRADALRMIKLSLSAEKHGLQGRFYIDAGGPHKDYDVHLRQLYENVKRDTKVPAVFEATSAVFAPQSCPEAALYVGWHSPRKYVPSMMWVPGAVGWHVAGCEARDLHDSDCAEWCPQMIRNGVAATVGGIGEPTLGAFPVPEDFFGLLLTGKHTVAECYWRTVGHVSWRMVLLADPLYNPFAANPQLDPKLLPKGLEP